MKGSNVKIHWGKYFAVHATDINKAVQEFIQGFCTI